jgi:hypothetical protein
LLSQSLKNKVQFVLAFTGSGRASHNPFLALASSSSWH